MMIGAAILINENGNFSVVEWPTYGDDWDTEKNFQKHYDDHVVLKNEFGYKISEQQYKDICKDLLNDKNPWSNSNNKFIQPRGRFVSLDLFSGLVAIGTPDGKIISCFHPSKQTIMDNILNRYWWPIPRF